MLNYRHSGPQHNYGGNNRRQFVKKRLLRTVKVVYHDYHRRRYSCDCKYFVSDEGLLERKPFTEDLFSVKKYGPGLSEDETRFDRTYVINTYSDVSPSDRVPMSDAAKIWYCKRVGIEPVAEYVLRVRLEKCGEYWKGSIEISRSYRGKPEMVDVILKISFHASRDFPVNADESPR